MVIGYVFHDVLFICKDGANESRIKLAWILPSAAHSRSFHLQRYKIKLRFASFPSEYLVKICLINTSIWQKNKKVLRLVIDALKTIHQSDGHGLPVRCLRNQSLLPTEKQQARLSLSASSVSILLACGNDIWVEGKVRGSGGSGPPSTPLNPFVYRRFSLPECRM